MNYAEAYWKAPRLAPHRGPKANPSVKMCTRCLVMKPRAAFTKRNDSQAQLPALKPRMLRRRVNAGLMSWCHECELKRQKSYRDNTASPVRNSPTHCQTAI